MWFKVDDHLHSHRKAMRAGTEAMGLWVLAGSWSGAELSDGWVPAYVLQRLAGPNGDELADRLVTAGLWERGEHDGEDGYRFRGWSDFQPTREQVESRRADARDRMRRVREQGGDVRANDASTSRSVTPTPTRPDPTKKNNTSRTRSASVSDDDPDWTAFWTAYPRKVAKGAARKAWAKAVRVEAPATIVRAAEAFAQASAGREQQFIPHPATWLNAEQWSDQLLPTVPAGDPLRAWTPPTPPPELADDPAASRRWQMEQRDAHLAATRGEAAA